MRDIRNKNKWIMKKLHVENKNMHQMEKYAKHNM